MGNAGTGMSQNNSDRELFFFRRMVRFFLFLLFSLFSSFLFPSSPSFSFLLGNIHVRDHHLHNSRKRDTHEGQRRQDIGIAGGILHIHQQSSSSPDWLLFIQRERGRGVKGRAGETSEQINTVSLRRPVRQVRHKPVLPSSPAFFFFSLLSFLCSVLYFPSFLPVSFFISLSKCASSIERGMIQLLS